MKAQLEGIEKIREMGERTNFWGWVNCRVGRMYLGGNDDAIAMRHLHGYAYEPVSVGLWERISKDEELVLDVGAHTGFYTLAAFKAGAKNVVSVEPYFLNAARLHLNVRGNGQSVVGCAMAAASDKDRVVQLYVPMGAAGHVSYCTGAGTLCSFEGARAYPVRACPLDTMLSETDHSKVAAIKLDVEYHLLCALKGATKILAQCAPDLIFELFEPGVGEFLKPYGYRFWAIDEVAGLTPVQDLAVRDPAGSRNYYATVRRAIPPAMF